jgi:hypothetical protein
MTQNERDEAIRDGLLEAVAVVLRYQKKNGRQLGVNEVCRDLKRLISEEATLTLSCHQSDNRQSA